jgi:hypothetical protein
MKINIFEAENFLNLLSGKYNSTETFQTFFDGGKNRPELARTFTSTLTDSKSFLLESQLNGCGVFVALNEFEGGIRNKDSVIAYRALFADCDGMPEPDWALMPHFTQSRDDLHSHAIWLVKDISSNQEYTMLQKRIAIYHGTDKTVCDPARVIRVAGFNHLKDIDNPKQYTIKEDNTDSDYKYTVAEIIQAFPLNAQQDAELNNRTNSTSSKVNDINFDNNPFYVDKFTNWITNKAPIAVIGSGSHTLYKVAAKGRDYAIPIETTLELMWTHYNPRCDPPWSSHERSNFNKTIKDAYQYASSSIGSKTSVGNFSPVPEPIGGWAENAKLKHVLMNSSTNSHVDYLTPLPNVKLSTGKPIRTFENLHEICLRLGVTLRYNVIAKTEEILIPEMGFTKDNEANASLAWLKSESAKFGYNPEWVDGFTIYLSEYNKYNPVINWIESKPWDGEDRLKLLLSTVVTSGDEKLKVILITKWLISAVIAAYSPDGISAQGILVFQGGQSIGKTRWFNSLVPKEFGLTKDGLLLKPDDKDSLKQALSYWLVELGEIDSTFRKSDITALKAFVTADTDVFRNPYAKKESRYVRRTVFFGSVNPSDFLADETGNRRYWTIPCTFIDHSHSIDMQQLWAQIKSIVDAGETHYLNDGELALLNNQNEDHSSCSPIADSVSTQLDWNSPSEKWTMLTATQIAQNIGIDHPKKNELSELSIIIKKLNGNKIKRTKNARLLLTPPKKYIFQ